MPRISFIYQLYEQLASPVSIRSRHTHVTSDVCMFLVEVKFWWIFKRLSGSIEKVSSNEESNQQKNFVLVVDGFVTSTTKLRRTCWFAPFPRCNDERISRLWKLRRQTRTHIFFISYYNTRSELFLLFHTMVVFKTKQFTTLKSIIFLLVDYKEFVYVRTR